MAQYHSLVGVHSGVVGSTDFHRAWSALAIGSGSLDGMEGNV